MTPEQACAQVRIMAASGEANALSSAVAQTLTRIADGLEERANADKGRGKAQEATEQG
jgi:hypothetical protein